MRLTYLLLVSTTGDIQKRNTGTAVTGEKIPAKGVREELRDGEVCHLNSLVVWEIGQYGEPVLRNNPAT